MKPIYQLLITCLCGLLVLGLACSELPSDDGSHDNINDPLNPEYEPPDTSGNGDEEEENHPPAEPFYPNPEDGATGIAVSTSLAWQCFDQDAGDTLSYNVYFGTAEDATELVSQGRLSSNYQPDELQPNTTYFWKVVAKDQAGASTTGPVWSFTTAEEGQQPPAAPSDPNPADGATDIPTTSYLSWTCSHPDDLPLTYDIHFGTGESPPLIAEGIEEASYQPDAMDIETTYYWKVVARDSNDHATDGPTWSFTTAGEGNQPPLAPSNPAPPNNADNISLRPTLSWSCADPEEDPLTYDVYFGTETDPPLVSEDQTETSWQPPSDLEPETVYHWKIVAFDHPGGTVMQFGPKDIRVNGTVILGTREVNGSTPGPVWRFTTIEPDENQPPASPSNPFPADGAEGWETVLTTLNWNCSDPEDDPLTYDVFFGLVQSPGRVAQNITETEYRVNPALPGRTYYWKVIAKDGQGNATEGPVWSFETEAENRPPETPHDPNPPDGAVDVPTDQVITWECADPDGDPVESDFYFGTTTDPDFLGTNPYRLWRPEMQPGTLYYWRVVCRDDDGNEAESPLWSFTTEGAGDELVFEYDFETDIIGQWPQTGEWDIENNGCTIEVSDDHAIGAKSLLLVDPPGDNYCNVIPHFEAVTHGRVEFSFYTENLGNLGVAFWMDRGGTITVFSFQTSGNIYCAAADDWHNAGAYNTGQWYTLGMEFDLSTQQFNTYINGVMRNQNLGFNGYPLGESLSTFTIICMEDDNSNQGFWIDDIRVYRIE